MNTAERRKEIIRILIARRSETMGRLSRELGVSARTIRSDVTALTVDYPLETRRGNGGYVKLADWYHPYRNTLSEEQQAVLFRLLDTDDAQQTKVMRQLLMEFGTTKYRQRIA